MLSLFGRKSSAVAPNDAQPQGSSFAARIAGVLGKPAETAKQTALFLASSTKQSAEKIAPKNMLSNAASLVQKGASEIAAELEKTKEQMAELLHLKNSTGQGELVVEIVSADGLAPPTKAKKPDPFVMITVRGRQQKSQKQTKTAKPVFKEELFFPGVRGELCTPKLQLEVFDHDALGSHVSMGSAEVDISKLITADADSLAVKLSTQGEVRLKLSWVPREMGKVVLHIQRAAGLEKVGSSSGMPSAYGVIVLHGKDHRTSTLKDTTTPEWKQKFEWTGIKSELTKTAMKIEIRDHDHAYLKEHGQAPVLGRAEVIVDPRTPDPNAPPLSLPRIVDRGRPTPIRSMLRSFSRQTRTTCMSLRSPLRRAATSVRCHASSFSRHGRSPRDAWPHVNCAQTSTCIGRRR